MTEGIATYRSTKRMDLSEGDALWGDYLSKEEIVSWLNECKQKEQEIARIVIQDIRSDNINPSLFHANDPKNILEFRAGYYLGMEIIKKIVGDKDLALSELLSTPRIKIEEMCMQYLHEYLN